MSAFANGGGYQPLTLAALAVLLAAESDEWTRRRLLLEFLEGYRWADDGARPALLAQEPGPSGDERWDVLLAGIAEHVAAKDCRGAPQWSESRSLERFWFPDNTPAARADSLVRSPAALRRRGIFIAAGDLERA